MSMFSTSGSSSSGCSRPTPYSAAWMPSASSSSSRGVGRGAAGGDLAAGVRLEDPADDGAGELALVLGVIGGDAGGGVLAALPGEDVGDLLAQPAHQSLVHRRPDPSLDVQSTACRPRCAADMRSRDPGRHVDHRPQQQRAAHPAAVTGAQRLGGLRVASEDAEPRAPAGRTSPAAAARPRRCAGRARPVDARRRPRVRRRQRRAGVRRQDRAAARAGGSSPRAVGWTTNTAASARSSTGIARRAGRDPAAVGEDVAARAPRCRPGAICGQVGPRPCTWPG